MLVENADDQTTADPGLLRIVARAHDIQARLIQNTDLTVHVIAGQERVSANYVYRLLRLPSLAPDIITAIVNGKNPPQLTAKRLMRLTPQIPVDWTAQRKLLGFRNKVAGDRPPFALRRPRPRSWAIPIRDALTQKVNPRKAPGRLFGRERPGSNAKSSLPFRAPLGQRKMCRISREISSCRITYNCSISIA